MILFDVLKAEGTPEGGLKKKLYKQKLGLNYRVNMLIKIFLVLFIAIMHPGISMATPPGLTAVYGVTIHLANNKKLNGYIETPLYLKGCDGKSDDYGITDGYESGGDNPTLKEHLSMGRDVTSYNGTIRFIDKLLEIKYKYNKQNRSDLVAAKSSVKEINLDDIKRIEGVCRKWDGRKTVSGIPIISDNMAQYVSDQKLIAFYIYSNEDQSKDEGKKECGLCSCDTTIFSFNPEYTRERLKEQRYKIFKMPKDLLEKERLIRFTECSD